MSLNMIGQGWLISYNVSVFRASDKGSDWLLLICGIFSVSRYIELNRGDIPRVYYMYWPGTCDGERG